MHAIELETEVNDEHEIHVRLPEQVKAHRVRIVILYDEPTPSQDRPKRVFGQYRGKIRIADDFDAPLPTEFWTGGTP